MEGENAPFRQRMIELDVLRGFAVTSARRERT
ncbi:putative membrane protein YeiB [Sphingomonas aerophila]|uniref:Putative membrane protein YeiB n=1 Tax=Sphingomonas aerophila TaxID=1344948 RepID=A0A7W9BFY3_9SPHN|nr:putative membrane protein YeiB [Sphingomonas aerophila]